MNHSHARDGHPAEVRYQLAAIMFTDVSGYTAMMASNEQKALDLLRESRKIHKSAIATHHGKWLKEMGDGVLAQFSAAQDAVRCACDIQRAVQALQGKIRIGIHLGDVAIEHGDIFGDGVNIAARIESIAEPGGIYSKEKIERFSKIIKQENKRMLSQVEKVLQIALIDKKEFKLKVSAVDMHQVIRQAIENANLQVHPRGGRIDHHLEAVTPTVEGDVTHLANGRR